MATDARRRQKKLQRRKAKEKAERRLLARQKSLGFGQRLAKARSAPIIHCSMSSELWEAGIGYILLSRRFPGGEVAVGVFLVDVFCLGVKDALARIVPEPEYRFSVYERIANKAPLAHVAPEYARKLVEEAVEYAAGLGLSPHPDYYKAKHIFGDIDAGACAEQFTFGKDGKPLFVAGPYDGPERCRQIMHTLAAHCGEGNYHYLVPLEQYPFDDEDELAWDVDELEWDEGEPEWDE